MTLEKSNQSVEEVQAVRDRSLKEAYDKSVKTDECVCGNSYEQIAIHWDANPSHRPSFNDYQHEVIKGLLMGDGCLFKKPKLPRVTVNMTNRGYLELLSSIFGVLGTSISKTETAQNRKTMYQYAVRCHPELEQYKSWYKSDGRIWPSDLSMTPTVFKHWYYCDGHLCEKSESYSIRITLNNERGNEEKIRKIFNNSSMPNPDSWFENTNTEVRWYYDKAQEIFDIIGQPTPSFDYKWPDEVNFGGKHD